MTSPTDRIEKRVFLRASQEKVWHAIGDAQEFGNWFGMELDGTFVPGVQMTGRIKPTVADAAVAKMQEPHAGSPVAFFVEQIEPMSKFSFRWHPFAVDDTVDYSNEPMTLVTFTLEPAEGGTTLTIVESGFDAIPVERRAEAFKGNEGGWSMQTQLIAKYLVLQTS